MFNEQTNYFKILDLQFRQLYIVCIFHFNRLIPLRVRKQKLVGVFSEDSVYI